MKEPARLYALAKLKSNLSSYPVVHPPTYGEPFGVAIDAVVTFIRRLTCECKRQLTRPD